MNSTAGTRFPRAEAWALAFLCLALSFALYHPTLSFYFVGDDVWFLRPNPNWFHGAVVPTRDWHYYPMNQIVLYLLPAATGLRAEPMHALNLLIHGLIGLGLALWLRRMGADRRAYWLAPVFFVARGINYEVVTWVTELSYLSVVGYTVLTLGSWHRYRSGEGTRWLGWTVAGFTLALLTFEHALLMLPLYFLMDLLFQPARLARERGSSLAAWAGKLRGYALPFLPFVVISAVFVAIKLSAHGGLLQTDLATAAAPAPVPSGWEVTGKLPEDRLWFGVLNTPKRAFLDLLLSTTYLFFPSATAFAAEDTWLTRNWAWVALPWLAAHLAVLWRGSPLARFLLAWVYIYMLPLALAGVPGARYYYMAAVPAAGLAALGVVAAWNRLRRRAPDSALVPIAVALTLALVYGEAVFIRARLEEWKLTSHLVRRTRDLMQQDLSGEVRKVYLLNIPRNYLGPSFPADAFGNAGKFMHLLVRPPRTEVTTEPVYDRTLVNERWPTMGRYLAREDVVRELQSPEVRAYEFIGREPWIVAVR